MGQQFAETGQFDKELVHAFAGPEYMPASQIRMFNLFGRPVHRIFMGRMARNMGYRERLDAKLYKNIVRQ